MKRVLPLLLVFGLLAGCAMPGAVSRDPSPPAEVETVPETPEPAPHEEDGPTAPAGPDEPAGPGEPGDPTGTAEPGEPSRLVVHGDRSCMQVALTYDAGSGAAGAEAILDVLKKHGVKATFFLTGKWAEQYPDLARRIVLEGHEVGNHSYSHPDLTTLSDEEVLREIRDAEEAIRAAAGQQPLPLFREPYGAFSDHERMLVRQAGYHYSIYWEVDTLDWQYPPVETIVERILRAQSGSIVLMHMNVAETAEATDLAIPQLREQGYEIVPVSRLLRCEPKTNPPSESAGSRLGALGLALPDSIEEGLPQPPGDLAQEVAAGVVRARAHRMTEVVVLGDDQGRGQMAPRLVEHLLHPRLDGPVVLHG